MSNAQRDYDRNEHNRTILLCTFVPNNPYAVTKAIREIKQTIDGGTGYVFMLENLDNKEQLLMVYNTKRTQERPRGTIQVSRNKETNTIYTISALNEITKSEDQSQKTERGHVKVSWDKYKNMLLIMSKPKEGNGESELKKYRTKLLEVKDIYN